MGRALVRSASHRTVWLLGAAAWFSVAILIICSLAGCRRAAPVVTPDADRVSSQGTISGTIRGPESSTTLDGRRVDVVNVVTNERHSGTTDRAGGFTFKLKPGVYRVELTLRDGEAIVRQPDVIRLDGGHAEADDADFVIGNTSVSRPRGPAYRVDDGLGSPVA